MYTCKEYVEIKKRELYQKIRILEENPKLVVIQIGDNPSSNSYIKGKKKDCEEVRINFELVKLPDDITNEELRTIIIKYNIDESVNGIILQLPVPKHIKVKEIQRLIDPIKDVDGFNSTSKFKPCTPLGIINYLKYNNYNFSSKVACVIGRSDIVGKPLAEMLLNENCTVIQCHSKTNSSNLNYLLNESDIVFTCIDKIEYFKTEFNSNQDIIDIGLGIGNDGKLHGNIEHNYLEYLKKHSNGLIISGKGNTGLLTRLELLNNIYQAFLNQKM